MFDSFSLSSVPSQPTLQSSSLQLHCMSHNSSHSHISGVEELIVRPQFDRIIIRVGEPGLREKCCMPFKLHDNIQRVGNTVVLSLGSRAFGQE